MENGIKNSIVGILFFILIGCGSANKTVAPTSDSRALDELVMSKQFKIDVKWVRPLMTGAMNSVLSSGLLPPGNSANRINVMGQGNFLQLDGGQVKADLPYFGERQMGGGYNSNTGIKFEGMPTDLKIIKNEDKQQHLINFTISEKAETYDVQLTLSSNSNATMVITSSQRRTIWYEGSVAAIAISVEQ